MKRSISTSIIALALLIVTGCASKKKVISPAPEKAAAVSSKAEALEAISAAAFDFSTLTLRAKTDLAINASRNDVTLNIRIRKDKAIWISVTALAGLEVARAMITPDSIRILNRIDGEYTRKPFSYVHQFSNEQLSFGMLQAILAGNAMPDFVDGHSQLMRDPLRLTGSEETLAYELTFSDRYKLLQAEFKDAAAAQTLSVSYGDFIVSGGRDFPQSVSIRSDAGNKTLAAELRYTKIEVNTPVDMPFNVPGRYTIRN